MTLPTNKEIFKVLSDIEEKIKNKEIYPHRIIPKDAPLEERLKYKISQKLLQYKISKGFSYEDMAKLFGTDRSNINKILNGHIKRTTLDRLLAYLKIVVIASKDKKMMQEFNKSFETFMEFEKLNFK